MIGLYMVLLGMPTDYEREQLVATMRLIEKTRRDWHELVAQIQSSKETLAKSEKTLARPEGSARANIGPSPSKCDGRVRMARDSINPSKNPDGSLTYRVKDPPEGHIAAVSVGKNRDGSNWAVIEFRKGVGPSSLLKKLSP
jgi:hypothetical protein